VSPQVRPDQAPLAHGGGQEQGLRPGTLPTAAIVGLGAAARLMREAGAAEALRLASLRASLWARLQSEIQSVRLTLPAGGPDVVLPGLLSLAFEHAPATEVIKCVAERVALSAGSACSTERLTPSHVLSALRLGRDRIAQTLRISVGRFTTSSDLDAAAHAIGEAVAQVRARNPVWNTSI